MRIFNKLFGKKQAVRLEKGDSSKISLKVGQAMPWFGMPGLGEKYVCEMNGENVTIPELYKLGIDEYVEQVELTDNKNYLF